jgi:hypothetical protein
MRLWHDRWQQVQDKVPSSLTGEKVDPAKLKVLQDKRNTASDKLVTARVELYRLVDLLNEELE